MASIRYGIVFLIALGFSHIFSEQMPLTGDYQFPLFSFAALFILGLIVCSSSWCVTLFYRRRIFRDSSLTLGKVAKFIGVNVITVTVVYTLIQLVVFDQVSDRGYAMGFMVISLLAIVENLSFLLVGSVEYNSKTVQMKSNDTIMVPTGQKTILIHFKDVAFFYLCSGIVYLSTRDGNKIATLFASLDELTAALPSDIFFRANRQYVIHRDAVTELTRAENRKLKVTMNGQMPKHEINVSRYKNKELVDWLKLGK